ncbi:MAG: 4Fe-4S binding protein [Myxococcales bacterium]|nr:4Fe-4S binding protein [Myxococcales bacterium]
MARGMVVIDETRCKGCGLCVEACPQGILALADSRFNGIGYRPVEVSLMERCTGCELCAIMCPDVCFTVYREAKKSAQAKRASGEAPRADSGGAS